MTFYYYCSLIKIFITLFFIVENGHYYCYRVCITGTCAKIINKLQSNMLYINNNNDNNDINNYI